ncbi:MAG: ATP-dependent helicase [Firmicutes bacterium]|nr:ATP-dependent helicase [Bacillota bacterium]
MQPTTEQQAFLDAEGKVTLCACPGSGKTYIVGKKLLKYLADWQHPHRGVAVLSFTNVASEEVLRQTSEQTGNCSVVGYPHFIGTLDSFIDNFIFLRFGYLMQSDPAQRKRPKILFHNTTSSNQWQRECYKFCAQNLDIFHWSDTGLLKNGKEIDCVITTNRPCVNYKKAMIKNGLVTQREVPALSLRLLRQYPDIAKMVAHRFPIIIVDEAQDTSREQMEILDLLVANGLITLILVGDPDQSIYEWRDATPEHFEQKMNDTQWSNLMLTENFRSSQHICNATSLFSFTQTAKAVTMVASGRDKDYVRKPILFQVKSNNFEGAATAFRTICEAEGVEFSSDKVAQLTRQRIHDSTDISDLWQHSITEWFARATYNWHCASRKEAFALCEKALFEMFVGGAKEMTKDEILAAVEKAEDLCEWKRRVISVLSILPAADEPVKKWRQDLIARLSGLLKEGVLIMRNGLKLEDIIKTKVRMKIGNAFSSEFLDRPLKIYFEKKAKKHITVSSVHGVKGETYDAVLLVVDKAKGGANTLTASKLFSDALNNELMRIAYVAMTRPRKLLAIAVQYKSTNDLTRFPQNLWEHITIQ